MSDVEAKLKDWIKSYIEMGQGDPDRYLGYDWFQVTPAEQEVFGLTPKDMIRAVPVHDAYEAIADIAHNDLHQDDELCAALRKAYPWITQGRSDIKSFLRFAALVDLPKRIAHAFYWKHEFWQVRQGLINFGEPRE